MYILKENIHGVFNSYTKKNLRKESISTQVFFSSQYKLLNKNELHIFSYANCRFTLNLVK